MSLIAVDMTPLLPGGENGGAKILVLQLLAEFQRLSNDHSFLLLTAGWSHQELAGLEGPGIKRLCILPEEVPPTKRTLAGTHKHFDQIMHRIYQVLPPQAIPLLMQLVIRLKQKLRRTFHSALRLNFSGRLLREHHVDLLFCPFTAPTYAEPQIPVVSVVYDLQHCDYPYFLEPEEISRRHVFFSQLCQKSDAVICISDHSRRTLLSYYELRPEQVHVVNISIQTRLNKPDSAEATLINLGVAERPYIFYGANFWPHKNHRMLLNAYNILLKRNRDLKIDLVFTGAVTKGQQDIHEAVQRMGLHERVHLLGYVSEDEYEAVMSGCSLFIFPSLYEGFGIPILEAFYLGKPVLCSKVTSLPEVAGDAALFFDPRKPMEIVHAIETLLEQPRLADQLVQRGYQQVAKFRQEDMAWRYLQIFDQTLHNGPTLKDSVTGIMQIVG